MEGDPTEAIKKILSYILNLGPLFESCRSTLVRLESGEQSARMNEDVRLILTELNQHLVQVYQIFNENFSSPISNINLQALSNVIVPKRFPHYVQTDGTIVLSSDSESEETRGNENSKLMQQNNNNRKLKIKRLHKKRQQYRQRMSKLKLNCFVVLKKDPIVEELLKTYTKNCRNSAERPMVDPLERPNEDKGDFNPNQTPSTSSSSSA